MIDYSKNNFVNKEVNEYLEGVIKNKIFSNGYIFYGADGSGKKQAALQFVQGVFNQYPISNNIQKKVKYTNHPDFLVIEPSSLNKGKNKKNSDSESTKNNNAEIITIEKVRTIQTFLSQKSIASEKKVVLIVDAHFLNEASSNCLLKTLEEPNNGIFILLTSKINLLLDTIKSRCQLIRFKALSRKEIKIIFENNIETSKEEVEKKLNFQDVLNPANGSAGKMIEYLKLWGTLSDEIKVKLNYPLKDNFEILNISKLISESLEIHNQINLINLIQQIWWTKTKNPNLIKSLENLKFNLKNKIQPRLAWEVTLLKISSEII